MPPYNPLAFREKCVCDREIEASPTTLPLPVISWYEVTGGVIGTLSCVSSRQVGSKASRLPPAAMCIADVSVHAIFDDNAIGTKILEQWELGVWRKGQWNLPPPSPFLLVNSRTLTGCADSLHDEVVERAAISVLSGGR